MKRNRRGLRYLVVAVVALLLIAPGAAVAQQDGVPSPPKEIYGTVTDQNGNTVGGETVTVSDEDGNSYTDTTDTDGYYSIKFPVEDGEAGENLTVKAKDSSAETTFESGTTERIDLSITVSGGGPSGPGGGPSGPGGGPSGPGGGPSGPGGAEDETTDDGDDVEQAVGDDAEVTEEETVDIETDPETGSSTATFGETSNVESITFSQGVEGQATVQNIEGTPDTTGSSIGTTVIVSNITVPEDARDSPATIRKRVSNDRLNELGVEAEELSVFRFNDGEWNQLDTEVVSETDSVVLEAETPGFSVFAVATVEDQPADDGTADDGTTEDGTTDDGDGETGGSNPAIYVIGLLVLIVVGVGLYTMRE